MTGRFCDDPETVPEEEAASVNCLATGRIFDDHAEPLPTTTERKRQTGQDLELPYVASEPQFQSPRMEETGRSQA